MNHIYTNNLKSISSLFKTKKEYLRLAASNLKPNEVKDENSFTAIINKVKKSVLLEPVVFGEPYIVNNTSEIRQMPASYDNPMGGNKEIHTLVVVFPFTGSSEIFEAIPEGVMFSAGRVYMPVGNTVTIGVDLHSINKEKALSEARVMMETTFDVIKKTNIQAQNWSESMELQIENLLAQRRKEILDLYS